jgi:hypothetical protein
MRERQFTSPSSGKVYTKTLNADGEAIACSCPGHTYHGYCKHLGGISGTRYTRGPRLPAYVRQSRGTTPTQEFRRRLAASVKPYVGAAARQLDRVRPRTVRQAFSLGAVFTLWFMLPQLAAIATLVLLARGFGGKQQ